MKLTLTADDGEVYTVLNRDAEGIWTSDDDGTLGRDHQVFGGDNLRNDFPNILSDAISWEANR